MSCSIVGEGTRIKIEARTPGRVAVPARRSDGAFMV